MARQLALKTIKAMIRNDWTKCNDDIKQISGVCSSYLRGKDPNMTLAAFQSLWCHDNTLASVTSPSGDVEDRVALQLQYSPTGSKSKTGTAASILDSCTAVLLPMNVFGLRSITTVTLPATPSR